MANYNVRDFLRDSIAGDVANGINQPKISANSDLSNKKNTSIPPILVVPPNMDEANFIPMIEEAYQISIYKNFQDNLSKEQKISHSLELMNAAMGFLSNNNYKAASDLFSVCTILYSNYFFNYLLALCRYSLQDSSGALELINLSISQLKDKQSLVVELLQLSKETSFSENFYLFYVILLIRNFEIDRAKETVQFSLENKIFNSIDSILTLIKEFTVLQEPEILSLLVQLANEKALAINNNQTKVKILSDLKVINL